MRTVKVYAASTGTKFGEQSENYGDNLMTDILRGLFDIEPQYVEMAQAELIGIGSILDSYHRRKGVNPLKRRPWRKLHAWGSGFMNTTGKAYWPQRLTVHAVRGPLSCEKVALPDIPMGDPAILLPLIWPKPATPTAAVSVIPHFITYDDFVRDHSTSLPKHWRIINLLDDPKTITEQIASSEIVVSSSLHGLIVADTYGIPAVWMAGDKRIKGDGFKFQDYAGFRGQPLTAPTPFANILRNLPPPHPAAKPGEEVQSRLLQSMPFA